MSKDLGFGKQSKAEKPRLETKMLDLSGFEPRQPERLSPQRKNRSTSGRRTRRRNVQASRAANRRSASSAFANRRSHSTRLSSARHSMSSTASRTTAIRPACPMAKRWRNSCARRACSNLEEGGLLSSSSSPLMPPPNVVCSCGTLPTRQNRETVHDNGLFLVFPCHFCRDLPLDLPRDRPCR